MTDGPAPTVDVLVPVLDEEADLVAAVEGIRAQQFDGSIEFLFIDGGSRDRTRQLLVQLARDDNRIRVLDNPARRTPNALNIGLHAGTGEFVARMDAHTHYPPDYLARGVQRLRVGDDVAHVSGPQVARGQSPWARRVALALSTPFGTGGAAFRSALDEETEVDSGFTGVWRRPTLERLGGWDEDWPVNQDAELAARIARSGGRLVCLPAMAADYVPRDSLRKLWRQYWRYGIYRTKTSGAHPASMRRSHLVPPALSATVVAAVIAPRPVRGLARAGVAVYVTACAAMGVATSRRAPLGDALGVPVALATMHLAWGFGSFLGAARFGPPVEAIARVLRLKRGGAA